MPSLTSQLCGDFLLAISLSWEDAMHGAAYKPPEHLQTSDRLKKEASVKADG